MSQSEIETFAVDIMLPEQKEKIDLSLTKLLTAFNIDVKITESPLFKEVISLLRPSYKIPDVNEINEALMEKAYTTLLADLAPKEKTGTLLAVDTDQGFIFMLKPRNSAEFFISSCKFSTDFNESIKLAIQKCKEIFSTEIEFVCLGRNSFTPEIGLTSFSVYNCTAETATLILTSNLNSSHSKTINDVLHDFGQEFLKLKFDER